MPANTLLAWMDQASPDDKRALATLAKLPSVASLHQMAHAYRTSGTLHLSSEIACRLDEASQNLILRHLPRLYREDLSPVCHHCDLCRIGREYAE